jgi:hypothetical protein
MGHPRLARHNATDGTVARERPLVNLGTIRRGFAEVGPSSACFFKAAWGHKEPPFHIHKCHQTDLAGYLKPLAEAADFLSNAAKKDRCGRC